MKHYFGLDLFVKAYRITHREIWVSVKLLLLVTIGFAIALFFA